MLARLRPRLNHATVVAYLALFVALGGGALAATSFVGSDGQIHGCVDKKGHLTLVKAGKKCGKGKSKKEAESQAALAALANLRRMAGKNS